MKEDAVLIIGAGILQVPMIRAAQAMGLKVVCTDGDPHAPGLAIADTHYVLDTYDYEKTAWLVPHMSHNIIGVCTAGADVAPTVALAAKAAGTPGIPYHVAMKTHNKAKVRKALHEAGLCKYQPRWNVGHEHYETCKMDEIGFPCVAKPLSQRASRGVSIAHNSDEFRIAVAGARIYGDAYIIEECLVGTEHSAEVIFGADGMTCWFNIVDRIFDYSSGTGIELGHVNPTKLNDVDQMLIFEMVRDAAGALGIKFGPFKIDVMMTNDGPKILECTARLSGGFDSQGTSPATGRHPMRTVLQLACNIPVTPNGEPSCYSACAAIMPKKSGTLHGIPQNSNKYLIWAAKIGQRVGPATHNAERAGFVLRHASTYHVAWYAAKEVADSLADAMDIG